MTLGKKNLFVILGVVLYLVMGIWAIGSVTQQVTEKYYDLLATKALDIAKISAVEYTISDREVAELRALSFREALAHPANQRLSRLFERGDFSEDIKYAYIMVWLQPGEVKYYVTEENAEWYGLAPGTPLNLLWLVDTVVNDNQQEQVDALSDYYDDNNRYSYVREADIPAFSQRKSTFVVSVDEYGNAFTGLVPIYSEEGSFVGLLGVDIYYEGFAAFTNSIRALLTCIFLLPTLVLTFAYFFMYALRSRKINQFANTDPLTSLYNRRYLDSSLRQIVRECAQKKQPVTVIMIDIDLFKNYNDYYGHLAGDQALISITSAISSSLRRNVDTICRYGGEEIIILLPQTNAEGAEMVANKIKSAVNGLDIPHASSTIADYITVSQGIFVDTPSMQEIAAFCTQSIAKADRALYLAKARGRNRFEFYRPDCDAQLPNMQF